MVAFLSNTSKTGPLLVIKLQKLSSHHNVHLQWISYHIGLNGNEIADTLAKGRISVASTFIALTLSEICSTIKSTIVTFLVNSSSTWLI